MTKTKGLGLYIHIPFCERKCYYCDFTSFVRSENHIDEYINYLKKELMLYKDRLIDYSIETIFIGGGTPSLIGEKHIYEVLNLIYNNYNIQGLKEVTIEVNPGSLTYEKANIYKKSGINRISLGVQSLNDSLLGRIGRTHNAKGFYNSYEILNKNGFENINVDMIFGLPGQELIDIDRDLTIIGDMDITHISYYGLILEPGTLLYNLYEKGKLELPSEEEEREMYHRGIDILGSKGYEHYEISNFSKPSYNCKHNNFYWKIKPYLGVGLSSHSNLGNKRFWNPKNFKDYYKKLDMKEFPVEEMEIIDKNMEIAEYLILGIRFIHGIDKRKFKKRFGIEIRDIYDKEIKKHLKHGLLIEEGNYLRLSKKGLDLANIVEMDFLP